MFFKISLYVKGAIMSINLLTILLSLTIYVFRMNQINMVNSSSVQNTSNSSYNSGSANKSVINQQLILTLSRANISKPVNDTTIWQK